MQLMKKLRDSLVSIIASVAISSCSSSCAGLQTRPDNESKLGTAIMITGTDARDHVSDAFERSNEMLAKNFQRSFRVEGFQAGSRNEQQLHRMIKNAANTSQQIIISYSGHGGLRPKTLADGRTLDAMFFPDFPPSHRIPPPVGDTSRRALRNTVRFVNNTLPTEELSAEEEQSQARILQDLNIPNTTLNKEYAQFYNPNDNRIYPQEILLLLKNYHGRIAFITNSCYSGQVNELLKRDEDLHALAFASSAYNEESIIRSGYFLFWTSGSYYMIDALVARFEASRKPLINLANERPDLASFIMFARRVTGNWTRHNIRDDGYNFQRFSRINEFYF